MSLRNDVTSKLRTIAQEQDVRRLSILLGFMEERCERWSPPVNKLVLGTIASFVFAMVFASLSWVLRLSHSITVALVVFTVVVACVALIGLSVTLDRSRPLFGYQWTRFFLMDQQERLISALVSAIEHDLPLVLYLRSFDQGDATEHYVEMEETLSRVLGNCVIVPINDPGSDFTERSVPLGGLLVRAQDWRDLVDGLIPLARVVVIGVSRSSEGIAQELQWVKKHDAVKKSVLIAHGSFDPKKFETELSAESVRAALYHGGWNANKFLLALIPLAVEPWCRSIPRRRNRVKVALAHSASSVLPRLYLYGWRDLLCPRDVISRYLIGRRAYAHFDATGSIRRSLLEAEKRAYASGDQIPSPGMEFDDSGPLSDELRRWNENKRLRTRMEDAALVLETRALWSEVRRGIRKPGSASFIVAHAGE